MLIPLLAGLLLAPTASATVPLGGGAGIMVDGTLCTLTTIGHDKAGDLVGFTAASCGGPGSPVAALGGGPIGSVVAVEPSLLKYGVIKFDPAEVAPTANFASFAINGIGPDPGFRQPACTDGADTGIQCGVITTLPGDAPGRNMAEAVFQPGDEGRPVTTDDLLFGMASRGWTALGGFRAIPESTVVLFSRILDDVNAKGGLGAGFAPVPA